MSEPTEKTVKVKPKKPRKPRIKRGVKRKYYTIRARTEMERKYRMLMLEKASYMDGVVSVPIIKRVAKMMGFNLTQMCLFITMNHLRQIHYEEAALFGFKTEVFKNFVCLMRKKGAMESFVYGFRKKKVYVMSLKGRAMFGEFQNLYHAEMKRYLFDESLPVNPNRGYRPKLYWETECIDHPEYEQTRPKLHNT